MKQAEAQQQKVTLIVGLGKTGLSCARYLRLHGRPFRVMDSRFSPPALAEFRREFPDNEPVLGGFASDIILDAAEIVLSPGISLDTPEIAEAVRRDIPVIGDIDIFSRAVSEPVAAVTGSNGKSTAVTLLGEMVRDAGRTVGVGGNLDGRASMPALDLLRAGAHDVYVLELSSFQLETTQSLNATVACILNLSEDHLDRYRSMEAYRAAKLRIFHGCRHIVVNRDDPATQPVVRTDVPVTGFGLGTPSQSGDFGITNVSGERWLCRGDTPLMSTRDIRLVGDHNVANVLAMLAMGAALGLPMDSMCDTVRRFGGLPHRCQWLGERGGIAFFNDSKGTNVAATVRAVESVAAAVPSRVVLIAGGIGKGADFSPLTPVLREHARAVVLIGRDAGLMAETFGSAVPLIHAASMEEAVGAAVAAAHTGDAVLLSPACASFDMFDDFSHRGRVFAAAVEALS